MPVFLDVHPMPSIDNEKVEELIGLRMIFDVTPLNFSLTERLIYVTVCRRHPIRKQ